MFWKLFVGALFIMSLGCSHVQTISGVETIPLTELSGKGEQFGEKIKSGQGVIIHVAKGDALPVAITASLPFAQLNAGDNELVATHDIYFYIDRESFLVGRDGTRFAPVYDMKGLKKIFGFKQGMLQVGFGMQKGEAPKLRVGVSTH